MFPNCTCMFCFSSEFPRPSLGCRVLVYRCFSKILPAILRDLTDWTAHSRIKVYKEAIVSDNFPPPSIDFAICGLDPSRAFILVLPVAVHLVVSLGGPCHSSRASNHQWTVQSLSRWRARSHWPGKCLVCCIHWWLHFLHSLVATLASFKLWCCKVLCPMFCAPLRCKLVYFAPSLAIVLL